MCGIYGFYLKNQQKSKIDVEKLILELITKINQRGSDGFGIFLHSEKTSEIHKTHLMPVHFIKTQEFKDIIKKITEANELLVIMQGRLATSGNLSLENQHPIDTGNSIFFHNGIYLNDSDTSEGEYSDSWKLIADIEKSEVAFQDKILSENTFIIFDRRKEEIIIYSNTGSMFIQQGLEVAIFGSEPLGMFDIQCEIVQLKKEILSFGWLKGKFREPELFQLGKKVSSVVNRCTICGINLAIFGVSKKTKCQICEHGRNNNSLNNIQNKNFSQLQELLKNKRVVVGFSGGRDSSYGLAILNEIEGIEIIAVTYDWGGVTNLGRRNQSRVCGKLGVEHIWISANLEKKRRYVQTNLLAWSKNPSLRTVPIMMAGDKGMWKYPHIIAKKRKADYVVFCTNPLERTDFKIGLKRSKRNNQINQPQSVAWYQKYQLLVQYCLELAKNPYLINRSIFENMQAFKYYFYDSTKNIQFYDYMIWEEVAIEERIIADFEWEKNGMGVSWRNGDLSAPFYNLVYLMSCGYSEFDAFRANQVRAKQISVEESIKMLKKDNRIDWHGLQEYCAIMGVPIITILRAAEKLSRKIN